jgi:hypothetical protein
VTAAEAVLFEVGWRRFRGAVARGQNRVDVGVVVKDGRLDRFLTLVARLPPEAAGRVADFTATMAAVDPGHYVYPPGDLHVTIADCSAYLGPGDLEGAMADLCRRLAGALAPAPTPPIVLRGMNVSPSSVFVQAWDPGGGVWRMRRRLRSQFHRRPAPRDRLSFVNVLRFLGPSSPALVNQVAKARAVSFGQFVPDGLELVLTDKALSASATTVVTRYALRAG